MKYKLIFIIGITMLSLLMYWGCQHIETYQVRGKVIDKQITSSKSGTTLYFHIIFQLENGEIVDDWDRDESKYYSTHIGNTYYFDRQRWKNDK